MKPRPNSMPSNTSSAVSAVFDGDNPLIVNFLHALIDLKLRLSGLRLHFNFIQDAIDAKDTPGIPLRRVALSRGWHRSG